MGGAEEELALIILICGLQKIHAVSALLVVLSCWARMEQQREDHSITEL